MDLSSFVALAVLFSSCGNTDQLEIDRSEVWSGKDNQVKSGGYWFTYADHLAWMAAHPDANPGKHTADQGATIAPLTDMTTPLALAQDPDTTSGHGDTIHVVGNRSARDVSAGLAPSGTKCDSRRATGLSIDPFASGDGARVQGGLDCWVARAPRACATIGGVCLSS